MGGDAKTDLSLLDRLTEAGEELINGPDVTPGAAEALMSFLVTGGVLIPHTDVPETAMPSLDVDVGGVSGAMSSPEMSSPEMSSLEMASLDMAARAVEAVDAASALTSTTGATGTTGAGADGGVEAASQPALAPALQAAAEDVLEPAGMTTEAAPATPPTLTHETPSPHLPSLAGATASEATPAIEAARAAAQPPSEAGHAEAEPASTSEPQGTGAGGHLDASGAGAAGLAPPSVATQPQTVTASGRTTAAPVSSAVSNAVTDMVADSVQAAVIRGDSEVRLVLNPPELGHLNIRIVRQEGGLRVSMEASQSGARDLIDRALPALQQGLEARDLRVDRLEVRAADTGRGSLDSSGAGQQPAGGQDGHPHGDGGDGRPEWSAVASLGLGSRGSVRAGGPGESGPREPSQQTASDGRLDVMA